MSQNVGVSGEESSDSMVQVHSLRHDTLGRGWEGGGREGREDGREEDRRGGEDGREEDRRGEKREVVL